MRGDVVATVRYRVTDPGGVELSHATLVLTSPVIPESPRVVATTETGVLLASRDSLYGRGDHLMLYTARGNGVWGTACAVSTDGVRFTRYPHILTPATMLQHLLPSCFLDILDSLSFSWRQFARRCGRCGRRQVASRSKQ